MSQSGSGLFARGILLAESVGLLSKRPMEPVALLRKVRGMQLQPSSRDGFVAAATGELEPFAWRSLTPEMLARRVLGAVDRHSVHKLLQPTSAPDPASRGAGEPVDRADERVGVLVEIMSAHRWRTWTLPCLVRQLVGALDVWWVNRQRLEVELSRLVNGDG